MKSFRQKIEEKKKILEQERRAQEENARIILEQQESDRVERQRVAKEQEAAEWVKEQELYEAHLWEQQERTRLKELRLERLEQERQNKQSKAKEELDWKENIEFKSNQKAAIQEILQSEQDTRTNAIRVRDEIENDLAHQRYLAEQERLQIELEEKERLQLEQMEKIEAEHIAEQEKYALWERLEKEENERKEKERLEEERIRLEDEELRKTAEMLERIEAERIEYEERQKRIAERQRDARNEVNKILTECQNILIANKDTSFKDKLSGLHDYIFRLDSNTNNDPWTNRKQPMSILTWEEWKKDNKNKLLIDEDFKRARLLFEQDNMRAKRYHDHIWHEMPARNLTIQRKQALADEGKLVDMEYNKQVSLRKDLVKDIGGIQVWLDAADRSSIHNLVTASINTASVSTMWVPASYIGSSTNTIQEGINLSESGSLVISGANSLFDDNPDTYMSIKHTSASYDWNTGRWDNASNHGGIIYVRFNLPDEHQDKLLERIDLYSTDRKFIPTKISTWHRQGGGSTTWYRKRINNISGSVLSNYNSQLPKGGEPEGTGGAYGITPEGSASMNPVNLRGLYPTREALNENDKEKFYTNDVMVRILVAATGSEVRFHKLKFWYQADSGSAEHGHGIHEWHSSYYDTNVTRSMHAQRWRRTTHPYNVESRNTPLGAPTWYSGSKNQPEGYNMPYVAFSSQSYTMLSPKKEFMDYTHNGGFTHIFVGRDTSGRYNYNNFWYGDKGTTYKTSYQVGISGYKKTTLANITDWDGIDDATSANQKHNVNIAASAASGEYFSDGSGTNEPTASAWPYIGSDSPWWSTQNCTGHYQRKVDILTVQLDNPIPAVPSASRFRVWQGGGKPFVDFDSHIPTDYSMTGSGFGEPQLGGVRASEWADFRLHEMIIFDKALSTSELDNVHYYLRDKWKLNNIRPALSDANNDPVFGISSSISSQDVWTYDGTDAAYPGDQDAWEIG